MSRADSAFWCDLCGAAGASHEFDIFKESGGGLVHTCEECTRLGLRLATTVREEFCLWCLEPATDKYRWLAYGGDGEPSHRICGDCRDQIIFTERGFTRGPRGGLP